MFSMFFKSKAIVTRVWTAPTYVICISAKEEQKFSITLGADPKSAFTTFVGPAMPSGEISSTFHKGNAGNHIQIGPTIDFTSGKKQSLFCPLFRLGKASQDAMAGYGLPMFLSLASCSSGSEGEDSSESDNQGLTFAKKPNGGDFGLPTLPYSTPAVADVVPVGKPKELAGYEYDWEDDSDEDEDEDEKN